MTGSRSLAAVAETVRAFAAEAAPGDVGVADHAVAVAEASYARTTSLEEACREGKEFVSCWRCHPARQARRPALRLLEGGAGRSCP